MGNLHFGTLKQAFPRVVLLGEHERCLIAGPTALPANTTSHSFSHTQEEVTSLRYSGKAAGGREDAPLLSQQRRMDAVTLRCVLFTETPREEKFNFGLLLF